MMPECEDLHSYADGELDPARLPAFETHLVGCAGCQQDFKDLMQLAALGEEAAARAPARPRVLVLRRLARPAPLMAMAATLLVSVVTGAVLVRLRPASGPELWLSDAPSRVLEARVSRPEADRHHPYSVARAGGSFVARPPSLTELGALERRGDHGGIAVAYLIRGQRDQAAPYLQSAGEGPEADVDRAAAALLRNEWLEALEQADRALRASPRRPQALWNHALALAGLGLHQTAADEFDQVAGLGEPGWSGEARSRAADLRRQIKAREEAWAAFQQARRRLLTEGTPLSPEQIRSAPGQSRVSFYDAVRAAPSRERVLALLPMAELLDQLAGDRAATDYVRRIAGGDFARRRPLAETYAALATGTLPAGELGPFLDRLRASKESDLLLGALLYQPSLNGHLEEYVRLATAAGANDPWFQLLAEEKQGDAEVLQDHAPRAVERLERALARCEAGRLSYRCLVLERSLSLAYVMLHQLVLGRDHAQKALQLALRDGEWLHERKSLIDLGQVARLQGDLPLARAYLEEALHRSGGDCREMEAIRVNLATAYYNDFQVAEARRWLRPSAGCLPPVDLAYIGLLSDLSRRNPQPEDGRRITEALAASRASGDMGPGKRALADHLEGRFQIERDRAAGQALLRRAIAGAAALPESDASAQKARTYSYTALLMDAGKHGEHAQALALFAEELGTQPPAACALGVTVDDERTLILARGPGGELAAQYDGGRMKRLETVAGLVPARLRKVLDGCAAVQVMARPPVAGLPDLLPPGVAWSYRVSRGALAASTLPARRLLVTGAVPPPSLRLSALGSPSPAGAGPSAVVLQGAAATPGRVLEAMKGATEIQIHAHGLVNPERSDASFIALSPDARGEFALTAEDLERARLPGRPLVLLAACYSARTAHYLYQSHGLAAAFVHAGAKTVLAATQEIPDGEAPGFFDKVLERIRAGQPAAVALRDERVSYVAAGGGRWVEQVLLFE